MLPPISEDFAVNSQYSLYTRSLKISQSQMCSYATLSFIINDDIAECCLFSDVNSSRVQLSMMINYDFTANGLLNLSVKRL